MDRSEVARPIIITLDGPNYIPWSQAMSSFLKGRKLWRYVTGDIKAPTQGAAETSTEFIVRLEEWDSKNHQIITWIRNTSIPSISLQFGRFDTAHTIWDFLATRYTTADLACQYQLLTSLCRQRQNPGQSISAFLPQIYSIWDQLTPSEPKWLCAGDSTLFATYRDQQRLILFLMGLSDIYEPVRASLLHRIPLPTLEQAISELLSEETRLGLISSSHVDTALAAPVSKGRGSFGGSRGFSTSGTQSSGSASRHNECTFCHATDHRLLTCPVRFCQYCRKKGPGHYKSDCPNNPTRRYTRPQSTAATVEVSSSASTPPTLIDVSDLPALVQQILSASGNPSTALSASSDVDVPTALLDGASHDVSPPLVYPVESPSTDPAPSVAPPTHLPKSSSQTVAVAYVRWESWGDIMKERDNNERSGVMGNGRVRVGRQDGRTIGVV
ncbi:Enhancer of mRNA-decapping protein [Actinidia chinensis var. chinensis]|uniref:Enhancer of mRNA-decapping protein n=1 Tax=Actinidia chinensis var. chinensis TaxID=1590841 RepID=A0A2R6PGX6_ACTCC|nr:Enhancer of mRNA-decapping protein [Actinidia chinensis var. chinensis]